VGTSGGKEGGERSKAFFTAQRCELMHEVRSGITSPRAGRSRESTKERQGVDDEGRGGPWLESLQRLKSVERKIEGGETCPKTKKRS